MKRELLLILIVNYWCVMQIKSGEFPPPYYNYEIPEKTPPRDESDHTTEKELLLETLNLLEKVRNSIQSVEHLLTDLQNNNDNLAVQTKLKELDKRITFLEHENNTPRN